MTLLARHTAAKVSSLFFLTPALSTIEGAILFDERLGALALVGLVIAISGVRLTMQTAAATPDATPDASFSSIHQTCHDSISIHNPNE